ncbi:unnamed protein product [Musa acuminata var. zebrina]
MSPRETMAPARPSTSPGPADPTSKVAAAARVIATGGWVCWDYRVSDGGGCRRRGGGACYNCVEAGHIARDCYSGGEGGGACYYCGEMGHFARDCYQGVGGDGRYSG